VINKNVNHIGDGETKNMINANVDVTNVILETNRLIIRPWRKDDLNDFYEYAKVDGVGQMAGWNPHTSIQESEQILSLFIEEKKEFALELKENHKVIGSLGLEKLSISLNEYYDNHSGREIGYVLSKAYWGKGLMPEAVKRVIRYCFEEENYDYLMCSHSISNNQSKKVIEKCGFRFEKENSRITSNGTEHISLYYVLDNGMK
jgi:ribosomal-protein-alanine N-acetyltransferase